MRRNDKDLISEEDVFCNQPKGLENVGSKSALKDRRAILEKLIVGTPEQGKAVVDARKPSYGGRDPLSASLAPVMNTIAAGGKTLSAAAKTQLGDLIGFGGTAGYDATLNGKVLNFAITEAVNNMVRDLQNGVWNIQQ